MIIGPVKNYRTNSAKKASRKVKEQSNDHTRKYTKINELKNK